MRFSAISGFQQCPCGRVEYEQKTGPVVYSMWVAALTGTKIFFKFTQSMAIRQFFCLRRYDSRNTSDASLWHRFLPICISAQFYYLNIVIQATQITEIEHMAILATETICEEALSTAVWVTIFSEALFSPVHSITYAAARCSCECRACRTKDNNRRRCRTSRILPNIRRWGYQILPFMRYRNIWTSLIYTCLYHQRRYPLQQHSEQWPPEECRRRWERKEWREQMDDSFC